MGKPTGFLEYTREDPEKREVQDRILDFNEFEGMLPHDRLEKQAARCMDCGVPHCHAFGCPIKNRIPEWNEMVHRGNWQRALDLLHSTNNFPEFTGKICPAPCEAACTLSINQPAVSIKHIELQIVERGWQEGWIKPEPAPFKTGRRVAVIGSGPAGLSTAQQLARKGHGVVVFEKDSRIGGLLRYGIPDFKMDKRGIDRRMEQMEAEGVEFRTGINAGVDITLDELMRAYNAVVITVGSRVPRDLPVPGRDLKGIYFAMDFLTQQNKRIAGDNLALEKTISAKDKTVVVIGGGDTGSDCIGTSKRQGAKAVFQFEILGEPPMERTPDNPWPTWPNIFRTSSSQEEGIERKFSLLTKEFSGAGGRLEKMRCSHIKWSAEAAGNSAFTEIPNSEFELGVDLVLLAMGFVHPEHGPLIKDFDLELDGRGNLIIDENYMTSKKGVFSAGDCQTGQSLVVRAMYHGRQAANGVDKYLEEAENE